MHLFSHGRETSAAPWSYREVAFMYRNRPEHGRLYVDHRVFEQRTTTTTRQRERQFDFCERLAAIRRLTHKAN